MTVKLFVGCSANGEDAEAQLLLEYTLRKHATVDVDLTWMKLSRDPASPWYSNPRKNEGWNTVGWATPFSPFRWAIPHVCNYEGRAIYTDVDMIFMADVNQLWTQPIPEGKCLLARNEQLTCVMLFDNQRSRAYLPSYDSLRTKQGLYRTVRKTIGANAARFSGNWNCLDGENYQSLEDPDVKLIHFTKVETQPHQKWAIPRLRASNQKHWGEHMRQCGLPHARKDVAPLVDKLWDEAHVAGYNVSMYLNPDEFYGQYHHVRAGPRAA